MNVGLKHVTQAPEALLIYYFLKPFKCFSDWVNYINLSLSSQILSCYINFFIYSCFLLFQNNFFAFLIVPMMTVLNPFQII